MSESDSAPSGTKRNGLRKWVKDWGLLVAIAGFVIWRFASGEGPGSMSGRAPDFSLPAIDGSGPVSLSSLNGKVRLVDFWATWCGPCKMMTPIYSDLYRKYNGRGVEIVGVALDDATSVKQYVADNQVPYRILLGDRQTTQQFGGVHGIPTTFILDKQGRIVKRHVGYRPEFVLEQDLEALL